MTPLAPTPPIPLSLADLCDAADVTPRTVRYYIQQGLLPAADGAGQSASYNPTHLTRLRIVKVLQGRHLPLAEIRARLEALTEEEARELLTPEESPSRLLPTSAGDYIRAVLGRPAAMVREPAMPLYSAMGAVAPPPEPPAMASASAVQRSTWEHYTLAKDIELHVRRPLDLQTNRRLERLIEAARAIFKETP